MKKWMLMAVIAMVVIAGAAVVLVTRDRGGNWPKYESLPKHPDASIKGTIAYLADKKSGASPCAYVVQASGGNPKELMCDGHLRDGNIGFSKEGDVLAMEAYTDFSTPVMYWQFAVDPPVMIDSYSIKPGLIDFTGDTFPLLHSDKDQNGVRVSKDASQGGGEVLYVHAPSSYELSFTGTRPISSGSWREAVVGNCLSATRRAQCVSWRTLRLPALPKLTVCLVITPGSYVTHR